MFCKDFHQIDVFEKACEKTDLGSVSGGQSDTKLREHSVEKYDFFRTLIFLCFLIDFNGLGSILGGPRASENC